MTALQEGDRVRVTFNASYRRGGNGKGHIVSVAVPSDPDYWVSIPVDAVVEPLPPPLKVGDAVACAEQLDDLPDGSVLSRPGQSAMPIIKRRGQWYASLTHRLDPADISGWHDVVVLRVGAAL